MSVTNAAAIMQLLLKISNDNDQLRQEVASIRQRVKPIRLLQGISDTQDEVQAEIQGILEEMHNETVGLADLHNEVEGITETLDEVSGTQDELHTMVEDVKETMNTQFTEMNERLDLVLGSGMIDNQVIRANIASMRSEMNTLRCSRHYQARPEFPFFKLPIELRIAVWKMACFNDPRIFMLGAQIRDGENFFQWRDHVPTTPSILQVCRESRSEGLKWFERKRLDMSFPDSIDVPLVLKGYINFKNDILFPILDSTWQEAYPTSETNVVDLITRTPLIRQFRRVAIDSEFIRLENDWAESGFFLSRPWSKIEEVIVVYGLRSNAGRGISDLRLMPMADGDLLYRGMWRTTVANQRKQLEDLVAAPRGPDIANYVYPEDVPSDDESLEQQAQRAAGNAHDAVPRKAPPVLTYMSLEELGSPSKPRVFFGS